MELQELTKLLKQLIREMEEKDHTAAQLELLTKLYSIGPCSSFFASKYGENLRMLGRCREAEKVLLSIKEIPEERKYLLELQLGRLYRDTGRMDQAESRYRNAVKLNPSVTETWVLFGNLLLGLDRFDEAIDVLTNGLNADGDLDEVHINLGDCYFAKRDFITARDYYLKAQKIDPKYPGLDLKIADMNYAIDIATRYKTK
jgi:tetratricopeptide (TPR) repeat protein